MKKLFFILFLLASLVSSAQIVPPTGFTAINQRYHWIAGRFQDSLYIGTGDFAGAPLGTRLSSILTTNSSSGHTLNGMFRANQTAATSGSIQGVEAYTKTSNATGTVTLAIGHVGNGEHSGAGTVTWMRSVQGGGISGAGTVTNWAGLYSQPGAITGTGTITNLYGVYLADPTQGAGTITNRWGVYSADDSATNYFAGFVRLAKAPATIDTTTYKPVVRNTTTGDLYTGSWQGAGGGDVPTLEEVLDEGFTVGGTNIDMEDMSILWTVSPGVVGDLVPSITASRDWILPDQSGTIALLSDIDNIYNTDGTLSGNRQLSGAETYSLTLGGATTAQLTALNVNAAASTHNIAGAFSLLGGATTKIEGDKLDLSGLDSVVLSTVGMAVDTTFYKPMVRHQSSGKLMKTWWSTFGAGGTPTLEEVATEGHTSTIGLQLLTVSTAAAGGGFTFNIAEDGTYVGNGWGGVIRQDNSNGSIYLQTTAASGTAGGTPSYGSAALRIKADGQINFGSGYGTSFYTGTHKYSIQTDASGNLVEGPGLIGNFTPANSTDNTYPNKTFAADNTNLYYRMTTGTWVKIAWTAF
jgi:hypothetical protein